MNGIQQFEPFFLLYVHICKTTNYKRPSVKIVKLFINNQFHEHHIINETQIQRTTQQSKASIIQSVVLTADVF